MSTMPCVIRTRRPHFSIFQPPHTYMIYQSHEPCFGMFWHKIMIFLYLLLLARPGNCCVCRSHRQRIVKRVFHSKGGEVTVISLASLWRSCSGHGSFLRTSWVTCRSHPTSKQQHRHMLTFVAGLPQLFTKIVHLIMSANNHQQSTASAEGY